MAAFTRGNIVVYRVGNGATALSSNAHPVFLDEYTAAGVLVQSIALPTADNGAHQILTGAGGSGVSGMLTRSANGQYLAVPGYDVAPGGQIVTRSTSPGPQRVIGRVDADGNIDTTTTTSSFNWSIIASAATIDGTGFWATGNNGDLIYQPLGGSGVGTAVVDNNQNGALGIFDNQLYVAPYAFSRLSIGTVGTGTPATAGQTITYLPGLPITSAAGEPLTQNATGIGLPGQFLLLDLTDAVAGVDTLYIASDGVGLGIMKFSLVSGSWLANGNSPSGATLFSGTRGLTGSASGSTATLFFTTPGALSSLVDTSGYNAMIAPTVTTIATASANTAFRGVAFAPEMPPLPVLSFGDLSRSRPEGNDGGTTPFRFNVERTTTVGAVTFNYTITGTGSNPANAGDFLGGTLTGTFTIADGISNTTITVDVLRDNVFEQNEDFTVTIDAAPAGYTLGTSSVMGTIENDDTAPAVPSLSINDVTMVEDQGGIRFYNFTVSLSAPAPAGGVTFDIATANGTAVEPQDYTTQTLTSQTIAEGVQTYTFTVLVNGDMTFEADENFFVNVTNVTGATVTDGQGVGTITNDDAAPTPGTVSVAATYNWTERDDGTQFLAIVLQRSGGTAAFSVDYATTGGTALANSDYLAVSGTAQFAANPSALPGDVDFVTISVPINGDLEIESAETFNFILSNASNGAVIGNATATITITDNDLTLTNILGADAALAGTATAPVATNAIQLVRQASIGGIGGAGAESVAFDSATARVYVTNPATGSVDVFQMAADGSLSVIASIGLGAQPGYSSVNSVAVRNGIIAIAYDTIGGTSPGHVQLYDTATRTLQRDLLVGILPDQLTFTPDGQRLVVANEGEALSLGSDPAGSISIIDLSNGAASATVINSITFAGLSVAALQAAGVAVLTSQGLNDIEPEYVSISPDGSRAYVTLQEVNAVAVIDLTDPTINRPNFIQALGVVDRNLVGNAFDPSDRDGPGTNGAINLRNLDILSLRQPDALASFAVGGVTYFITANEGDGRANISDLVRLSTVNLDPTAYPDRATLQSEDVAGRLNILSTLGDSDNDGDIDQIYTIGGRGFTIYRQNADGTITTVRESGGEFEAILARDYPAAFNSNQSTATSSFDARSDDKGPEPEGVAVGVINVGGVDRTFAFITNERIGGVMIYDVTDPATAAFVSYIPQTSADLGPETLVFVGAATSPTGTPLLVVANEISGTTTVYRVVIPSAGNNMFTGGSSADILSGNDGNDLFLLQQGGDDNVSGGVGNDGFYFGSAFTGNDRVDGGVGTLDQVGLQGSYTNLTLTATSAVGIEQFVLLPGSDVRFGAPGTNTSAYNIITGDAAIASGQRLVFQANTLRAGENFTLNASGELDGSVFTYGGLGNDVLTGSQGGDAFFFGTGRFGAGDVVDGQGGSDQVGLQGTYSGANALTFGAGQLRNVEMLVLLGNNDSRFGGTGSGTPYAYSITMNDGNVTVGTRLIVQANNLASDESLTFNGSAEQDGAFTIYSGNGADAIIGSAGADTISGRGNADTLTGGLGNDVFLYTNLTDSIAIAQDHIFDFTVGDVINLSAINADAGAGNDAAFSFIGSSAFSNVAGQLRATTTSGNDWLIEGDVNGDGIADIAILVTTSDADPITASDFIL